MSNESGAGPRGPQRLRASDAEREQVAQVLRAAMTEGRLTLAEGEERLGRVYAAAFRDELTPLVADLPGGGWQALRDTPEAKAHARRHLRGRFGFAAVLVGVLLGALALSGAHFFWPAIPLVFIAICLARHRRWRQRSWPGHQPPWTRR